MKTAFVVIIPRNMDDFPQSNHNDGCHLLRSFQNSQMKTDTRLKLDCQSGTGYSPCDPVLSKKLLRLKRVFLEAKSWMNLCQGGRNKSVTMQKQIDTSSLTFRLRVIGSQGHWGHST